MMHRKGRRMSGNRRGTCGRCGYFQCRCNTSKDPQRLKKKKDEVEGIERLKKFIEENNILPLAEDLNYHMAILDGSWPQSVEILTKALENAKALKGSSDE